MKRVRTIVPWLGLVVSVLGFYLGTAESCVPIRTILAPRYNGAKSALDVLDSGRMASALG